MRSRYYNPEIKRFINQDILTGSIGNSASLNRYSYVEGNPVSYTDPFGLSPFAYMSGWIKIPKSIHIALECLGCIPGCDVFDYINAGLYLLEGDVNGVIRALPVANLFGKYSNYFIKGTRILSFGMCGFGEELFKNIQMNCTPYIDTLNNLIGMNALGMHSTTDTPQIKTSDDVIPNPNKNMEEELSYKNNENYGNTSGSTEFKGGRDFYVTPGGTAIPNENYHSMSNVDARKWYLSQEAKIPDLIDTSQSLEKQAYQAFTLRNEYRTTARELMADRVAAESLYITDPNLTWEKIVNKQIDRGLTGDDIYRAIIGSSQKSRNSVNKALGLE